MSGKAYIRHILSIYSAYIGTRWKAGGREDALPFYMPISNRRKCQESFFGRLSEAGDESGSGVKNNAENDNRDNMPDNGRCKNNKERTYVRAFFI